MFVSRALPALVLTSACMCAGAWCMATEARAQEVPPQVAADPGSSPPVVVDSVAQDQAPDADAPAGVSASTEAAPEAAPEASPAPVLVEIPQPPAGYGVSAVAPPPAPAASENPMMGPNKNPSAWVEPGTHEHDGFFFRATLGFGGSSATGDYDGTTLGVSGGGGFIALAFGKVVTENFALYGELQGLTLNRPDVRVDDEESRAVRDVAFSSIGLGGSYYLMPLNAFVGGTLGIAMASVNRTDGGRPGSDPDGRTGTGLSLGAHAGKEWWVSANWGIGVAIYATFMSLPDGDDSTLSVINLGLGASATYN